jgi:hypothetical protein
MPVIEPLPGAIYLYHHKLVSEMKSFPAELTPEEMFMNNVNDLIEYIIYIISLYMNGKPAKYLLLHILKLASRSKELIAENVITEYSFYLYPLLAKVLQYVSDELSGAAWNTDI